MPASPIGLTLSKHCVCAFEVTSDTEALIRQTEAQEECESVACQEQHHLRLSVRFRGSGWHYATEVVHGSFGSNEAMPDELVLAASGCARGSYMGHR